MIKNNINIKAKQDRSPISKITVPRRSRRSNLGRPPSRIDASIDGNQVYKERRLLLDPYVLNASPKQLFEQSLREDLETRVAAKRLMIARAARERAQRNAAAATAAETQANAKLRNAARVAVRKFRKAHPEAATNPVADYLLELELEVYMVEPFAVPASFADCAKVLEAECPPPVVVYSSAVPICYKLPFPCESERWLDSF